MLNQSILEDALLAYKDSLISRQWGDENYKGKAVQWFQDNWDLGAIDFSEMLNRSLDKAFKLLTNDRSFPIEVIVGFAKLAPEEVRSMFIELFNEREDLAERISAFELRSSALLKKYDVGVAQHYQNQSTISIYLWLRYPDKYYIYRLDEAELVASLLETDYLFKRSSSSDNIHNFMALYDEINLALKEDSEYFKLLKSQLTDSCYPDPELKVLTVDVVSYITWHCTLMIDGVEEEEIWQPSYYEYTPGISVEEWLDLLGNPEVFTTDSLEIMKRIKDLGGQATCKHLAKKFGRTFNYYIAASSALAKRIASKTGCQVLNYLNSSTWWPVLFIGRDATKYELGSFVWRLRDELSEALDMFDLSDVKLYAFEKSEIKEQSFWWLNIDPKTWRSSRETANIVQLCDLNQNKNSAMISQEMQWDIKAGDTVIICESSQEKQIVGIGYVERMEEQRSLFFEALEELVSPISIDVLQEYEQLGSIKFFGKPQGSLFKIPTEESALILNIIHERNPSSLGAFTTYNKKDFLDEVFITEQAYESLVGVLRNKQNIILQGAPGVGKTFIAKRLAWSMMGVKDDSRIEFIQFHQNYSYEDFMMGYKPVQDGFELKYGVFYRFCQKAASQPTKDFYFIIDEINRGNMSKIFGELLMLIEKDYRGTKMSLAYNGVLFEVPKNLYIIGMMNTADRSLALIDYALRRRFSFFEVEPGFNSEGFIKYKKALKNERFNKLISKVEELNQEIVMDNSLGKGFCIGHSYFCGKDICTDEWLRSIVDYDLIPMLSEYWFDDLNKLKYWEKSFQEIFSD